MQSNHIEFQKQYVFRSVCINLSRNVWNLYALFLLVKHKKSQISENSSYNVKGNRNAWLTDIVPFIPIPSKYWSVKLDPHFLISSKGTSLTDTWKGMAADCWRKGKNITILTLVYEILCKACAKDLQRKDF